MCDDEWIACENATSSGLGDNIVVLNHQTNCYFTMNSTGSYIWKILSSPARLSEIILSVSKKFDVDLNICESDVRNLLAELHEAGLIEVVARELVNVDKSQVRNRLDQDR